MFLLLQWRKRNRFTAPFSFVTPQTLGDDCRISYTALALREVCSVPIAGAKDWRLIIWREVHFRSPQLRECGKLR